MSSADTNNIGLRLQAAGENLNTWGDPYLNNDLIVLSNLCSKFKTITINGDYTVSETNYATTNDTEVALIKLLPGTVTAAFNFTLPSRNKRLILWNTAGYTATPKLSASSGFTLPNNGIALLASDSTDVYNVSATHAGTTTQDTSSNAFALWGAVQAAIAAASGLTAPFILISGTDTTAGYAGTKLTASGLIKVTIVTPAGNSTLNFAATGYTASEATGAYTISAAATSRTAFATAYLIKFTNANPGPATLNDGPGVAAITKNGSQALGPNDIPAGAVRLVVWDGTQFQIPVVPPPAHLPMAAAMALAMQ